jgi:predicted P-loop ATPase
MVGDVEAIPGHTEMAIANHFQYNFQMDKVKATHVLETMEYLAVENQRKPFLEWVKGIEWDGVERLDRWMVTHWGVEDSPYVREVSAKFLISSLARQDKAGTKIDWMLITIGPQGTGKTSMPEILFKGNNTVIYGDHDDKDLKLLLHSSLCAGFDELDSFNRREAGALKALITSREDNYRPPYARSNSVFPRRVVLY